MITGSHDEGGAGITPKHGEWKHVESIFALHDHEYNKKWLKKWATQYMLKLEDLDDIRDRFGERVAFYFAFTQSYFNALILIAIFGVSSWLLLGYFSPIYGVINGLMCITFVEYWRQQEHDLAVRWGVQNVSSIESRRLAFQPDDKVTDPVTGEVLFIFSRLKRLQRQILIVPFAILATVMLGAIISLCFGIEIFISELYKGPGQSILVFLPTVIITTVQPLLLGILTTVASKLTEFENHETDVAHDMSFTTKIFVLNFITSYVPIFLTAFVYVPFANVLVPYLDVFNLTVENLSTSGEKVDVPHAGAFNINPSRLRSQVIFFTVTGQIVNQAMEVGLPYAQRMGMLKFKEMSKRVSKHSDEDPTKNDAPDEAAFLKQVRNEAALPTYDVTSDLREMVVQYGYLAMFGLVFPPTGASFLANNWFELRTDAFKICMESQRPTPWRADSIGPWLDFLVFLTWMGSITTSAVAYLFSGRGDVGPGGDPASIKVWGLLLWILASEHAYLLSRSIVRLAISRLDWPGRRQARAERYLVRKKYLEESTGEKGLRKAALLNKAASIANKPPTRGSLEDEVRDSSKLHSHGKFWSRQRGWEDTVSVGRALIEKASSGQSKKTQ